MTTLHVRHDRLERAIEGYPVVRALEVRADFPHGLSIHVIEHHPAALVVSGRSRVPVAADGSVLRGLPVKAGDAAAREGVRRPAGRSGPPGGHARPAPRGGRGARAAAEPESRRSSETSERGIVLTLEDGPELIFGDPSRVRDKWTAATQRAGRRRLPGGELCRRPAAGATRRRRARGRDDRAHGSGPHLLSTMSRDLAISRAKVEGSCTDSLRGRLTFGAEINLQSGVCRHRSLDLRWSSAADTRSDHAP